MEDNVSLYRKMLLSELYKIMVNVVTFYIFRGSIIPIAPVDQSLFHAGFFSPVVPA